MSNHHPLVGNFINQKICSTLIFINKNPNTYGGLIIKSVDVTYSHMNRMTILFKKLGLITDKRKGRINCLSTTEKGKRIAELLEVLKRELPKNGEVKI